MPSLSEQSHVELIFNAPIWLNVSAGTLTDYNVVIYKIDNRHFHAENYDIDVADADLELFSLLATEIPVKHIQPLYRRGFKVAPNPLPNNIFVKTPSLAYYDFDASIARTVMDEVKVLEQLKFFPHPNVASYHGCLLKGNRITGLVFTRYVMSLNDRLKGTKKGTMPLPTIREINNWCRDIENGLNHLHGLGFVHQDLDPRNVMLDTNDRAIIIDFDSCQREGHFLGPKSHGTPPWILEQAPRGKLSDRRYDIESLRVIRKYLEASRAFAGPDGLLYSPVAPPQSEPTRPETVIRHHVIKEGEKRKRDEVEVIDLVTPEEKPDEHVNKKQRA